MRSYYFLKKLWWLAKSTRKIIRIKWLMLTVQYVCFQDVNILSYMSNFQFSNNCKVICYVYSIPFLISESYFFPHTKEEGKGVFPW